LKSRSDTVGYYYKSLIDYSNIVFYLHSNAGSFHPPQALTLHPSNFIQYIFPIFSSVFTMECSFTDERLVLSQTK